jgi:hypothetical protein
MDAMNPAMLRNYEFKLVTNCNQLKTAHLSARQLMTNRHQLIFPIFAPSRLCVNLFAL